MSLRPRHPGLFLLALAAAAALWHLSSADRREDVSVRGVKAALTLVNIPPDIVITSTVPESVSVQLRGPLSRALEGRATVEVLLDLANARPGVQSFAIDDADIQVPREVSVVSVDPPEITLQLEGLEIETVPVRVELQGAPAPGFAVGAVRVAPARIALQGPTSLLDALDDVETMPVEIEGATEPVEATTQPRMPHPLVRTLTGVPLLVRVDIVPAPPPQPSPDRSDSGRRRPS